MSSHYRYTSPRLDRERNNERERERERDRANFIASKCMSYSETKLHSSASSRSCSPRYRDSNRLYESASPPLQLHCATPQPILCSERLLLQDQQQQQQHHHHHSHHQPQYQYQHQTTQHHQPQTRLTSSSLQHHQSSVERSMSQYPLSSSVASQHHSSSAPISKTRRVLLGCTGSVATIKLPQLVKELVGWNCEVRIVVTERAKHFLKEKELPPGCQVLSDTVEWAAWQDRGDPVLHIDLAKWADVFLIAPLDANSMGKLASGICDNLLTCVARAWDTKKPLLFCPAMNTRMWEHPVTAPQVSLLKSWGYKEVPCISKTLMCGDTGIGGMAEIDTIVQATLRQLSPWDPYSSTDSHHHR
ncbi:hypothetical protein TKK_0016374 [Trichogramma kaykai]|uniref:Phosphopantothenoylcysteine decarboxylase n=1 Tax=Trichogramma kaykai TaxID=54128 RepID=A0ABD2W7J9_9HYME